MGEDQRITVGSKREPDGDHKNLHGREKVQKADDQELDQEQRERMYGVGQGKQECVFDCPERMIPETRHKREDVDHGAEDDRCQKKRGCEGGSACGRAEGKPEDQRVNGGEKERRKQEKYKNSLKKHFLQMLKKFSDQIAVFPSGFPERYLVKGCGGRTDGDDREAADEIDQIQCDKLYSRIHIVQYGIFKIQSHGILLCHNKQLFQKAVFAGAGMAFLVFATLDELESGFIIQEAYAGIYP